VWLLYSDLFGYFLFFFLPLLDFKDSFDIWREFWWGCVSCSLSLSNFLQASQAFLLYKSGGSISLPLLFVKEMPKEETQLRLDFSSLIGPLFYMWVLGFLFPVSNNITF
jgi:hypothetical protein